MSQSESHHSICQWLFLNCFYISTTAACCAQFSRGITGVARVALHHRVGLFLIFEALVYSIIVCAAIISVSITCFVSILECNIAWWICHSYLSQHRAARGLCSYPSILAIIYMHGTCRKCDVMHHSCIHISRATKKILFVLLRLAYA